MKYSKTIFAMSFMLIASSAAAQLDPDARPYMFMTQATVKNQYTPPWASTTTAHVFSETALHDVVVEHWVARSLEETGVRFGAGRLVPGKERYESSNEFLRKMWWQSVELDEQWFYARQTVIYKPLAKLLNKEWEYAHPPISCLQLVTTSGHVVGHQVRTEAWSLYTDHWVLYPEYWPLARRGAVEFVDASEEGCEWPGDLIERELSTAQRRRDLASFQYATATFNLVPLKPTSPSDW